MRQKPHSSFFAPNPHVKEQVKLFSLPPSQKQEFRTAWRLSRHFPNKFLANHTVCIYSFNRNQQPTHEVTSGRSSNVEM